MSISRERGQQKERRDATFNMLHENAINPIKSVRKVAQEAPEAVGGEAEGRIPGTEGRGFIISY